MLKKIFLTNLILIIFLSAFLVTNLALAQFGLERFEEDNFLTTGRSATEIIIHVIRYIIGIIGIILLALIIYGGILYATSAGSEEQVEKAKKTLKYSIIGIVIVALSFSISTFLVTALFTDESLTVNVNGGGGNGGGGGENGGSGETGDSDSNKAQEMVEEGNALIEEGGEMLDRGSELRRQAAEASGEERERLLEEAEEIESEGIDRIDDGRRLVSNGEAILEAGGDGTESSRGNADRTEPADVDTECGREGNRCGWFATDCCSGYECEDRRCTAGDPECHEGEEGCSNWGGTVFGDPCCEGLICSDDTWVPGGGECGVSE